MIRSPRRLLAATAVCGAIVSAPVSAMALTSPTAGLEARTLARCAGGCSAASLRAQIVHLRARAMKIRDERGLLRIHLRRAYLHRSTFGLIIERTIWRSEIRDLRRRRPLWRTLHRWDDWMCIHQREGAWNSVGGIYRGGLQMNSGFQATYGPDMVARYGTADRWPVAAQVAVAERAYKVRGFSPWPNTARHCGLL